MESLKVDYIIGLVKVEMWSKIALDLDLQQSTSF